MDGAFVYGVLSTQIYCRPSCPARRPIPSRIVLFAVPVAAEDAGFRPCRRCHPQEIHGSPQSEAILRVCHEIDSAIVRAPALSQLAASAGMSASHLQRTFRRATGITPRQYADAVRTARLKSAIRKGTSVTDAMYGAGYGSSSRLYEQSDAHLGMTPATYGRGGLGMHISYSIADCSLGRVLAAGTERGISAVYLGDSDARLSAALRKEYPQAEIRRAPGSHAQWTRAIIRHVDGEQLSLDLPTDVLATAFQRRVWEALRAIPYGTTRSYSELARMLGSPNSTRAVARACATNPVSIVVPCHRVVRSDGSLAGYRWGLRRKELLLERERANATRKPVAARKPIAAATST
jgi:AraC family transcriptional regulator, regulatory protein of adaptative response / methylated-DNA-[protein]-cysteine methyltransferase